MLDNEFHINKMRFTNQMTTSSQIKTELNEFARLPPIATHFYTTHSFSELIAFLQIFPHTSFETHPCESVLCAVTWDENNTWAKYIVTLSDVTRDGGDSGTPDDSSVDTPHDSSVNTFDKSSVDTPDDSSVSDTPGVCFPIAAAGDFADHHDLQLTTTKSSPSIAKSSVTFRSVVDQSFANDENTKNAQLKLVEFNHTFGKSDVWITLFHSLRHKFSHSIIQQQHDDKYNFRELRCWPTNYDDSPPNGEFFTMILGLCHDAFLESYTLGATYLADYVKKYNRQQLMIQETIAKIELAAIQLVKTDHPQCIRCAAEIAKILQLLNLKEILRNWTPPNHIYFENLMWTDPIEEVRQAIEKQ